MFDLLVIGGGPGGYLAAERAARAGLRVALFEKENLGGVCLNEGCIPSKTLLQAAKTYTHALEADRYGVSVASASLDQAAVIRRKNKVVRTLVNGVKSKLQKAGVTVIAQEAQLLSVAPFTVAAGGQTYEGKAVILATGSSPAIPPIPGVRENLGKTVLTSREILDLTQVPKTLAVIGGGVIGLEMAAYYAAAGAKVTVVEMLSQVGGGMDNALSAFLQKSLEAKGIRILTGHRCLEIGPGRVTVQGPGTPQTLEAELVLLATGRRPNTQGLEALGVTLSKGAVVTDSQCRTNIPGLYAVGDVNGHHMLAHTAYREAEVAVATLLGKKDAMRYHANPAVIYTAPEVAWVGMTEENCRQKGTEYEAVTLSMRYSGRFVAENEGEDGLCKVIVDKKRRTVLGVHLLGSYAGEIIWGAAQMLELHLRVSEARQIIFPHPTVSEILREALWEFPDP